MSRTGCLVANDFIPSLSICLHFCPNLVLSPFSLAWTRGNFLCPGPSALTLAFQSVLPEATTRGRLHKYLSQIQTLHCSQAPPPNSPPTFLRVGPLVFPLAHTALHHLPLSSPRPARLPSLSLSLLLAHSVPATGAS